jgi:hypothetical protein
MRLTGSGVEFQIIRLGVRGTEGREVKTTGYSKAKSRPRRKAGHDLGVWVWVLERRRENCSMAKLRSSWEHKIAITGDHS